MHCVMRKRLHVLYIIACESTSQQTEYLNMEHD